MLRRRLRAWTVALLWSVAAVAQAVGVDELELVVREQGSVLTASLAVELSDPVIEALEHGVPLTFAWTVVIADRGVLGMRRSLWDADGQLRLDYRPLSRRYSLTDLGENSQQSFPDLRRLLEALGNFRQQLPPLGPVLGAAGSPQVRFRVRLEIAALPPAMRLPSYLDEAWRLDSGWIERAVD